MESKYILFEWSSS